jgi:amylosucrase
MYRVDAFRAVLMAVLTAGIVFGFGGLPLLYMGDELALTNDYSFAENPDHADDNRWVHRPAMPWDVAERRHQPGTLEHRVWQALRHAVAVRSSLPGMDASVETEIMDPVNSGVLVFLRRAPTQTIVGVYNVTPDPQTLPRWVIALNSQAWDALTEDTPLSDADLKVEPYQARWFVQQT